MRFDRRIRFFGSAMFTVGVIVWLPIAVYVPALTFNQVTGINIHIITPVVCIVCTFYTCVGGLKAVVWTDVLQSFVMFGSIFLVIIKGTMDLGGFGVVWQRNADTGRLSAPEMSLDPTVRLSVLSVFIGGTLHKLQSSAVNQITIQRFISLPSTKKARHTLIIFTIGLTLLLSCCAYVGLLTFATYHDCDPLSTKLAKATDQLVPLLVMHILGVFPGLPGLFVSGVFSAALSSLSTGLNSLSCVILEDFINPAVSKPLTERQTAFILRFTVAFFGLSCIGLVFVVEKLGMVLQLATTVGAVTQGPLLGIFFMGICMPWINGKSALTGSVVSFVILGWTCIKAQIALASGELKFAKKPVSVEGCLYAFDNSTLPTEEFIPSEKAFHHMSFLWYSAFGGALTIIVACIASLWFGNQDVSELDESLFAPCIRRFIKTKKYGSVQLDEKFGGFNSGEKEMDKDTGLDANSWKEPSEKNYFERRFDRRIQLFGAILFIIESSLWLPIAVYVPALTFNQVTGIDIHIITPIVCAICTFYTCVGGIKAVVCADFIQGFVMFGSVFLVMIKGTMDVGGFGEVWQRNKDSGRVEIPELTFDPTVRMSMLAVIVGGTIYKIQDVAISQPAVQRFVSLPSLNKIGKTLFYSCFGLSILLLACVYVGMVTFATYHDCDPLTTKLAKARDQLVPLLVMDVLGSYPGLGGLFVSAVFSAALSSLSTVLNSLSAVILEDFAKPFSRNSLTENQTAIVMRTVVIFFGVFAVGMVYVVEKLGMVLQLSATLQSITKGPMLGIFIVGMCMPWVNSRSVLVGSGISFMTMGWICIRAQIAVVRNEFVTPAKPVSVEGCTYDYAFKPILNSTLNEQPMDSDLGLHHVSWLWYGGIGAFLTIACSNLAMVVFGIGKWEDVDEELVAPFLRKYYKPKKYESVTKIDMAED